MARIGRPMPRAASAKTAHKIETRSRRLFGGAPGSAGAFDGDVAATAFEFAGVVVGVLAGASLSSGPAFALLLSAFVTSPMSCDMPRLTQFCTNIIRQ